jgi:hypothetical protein
MSAPFRAIFGYHTRTSDHDIGIKKSPLIVDDSATTWGFSFVGPRGLEPRTSSLSGMRSNRAELWAPTGSQGASIVLSCPVEAKCSRLIGLNSKAGGWTARLGGVLCTWAASRSDADNVGAAYGEDTSETGTANVRRRRAPRDLIANLPGGSDLRAQSA